MTTRTRHEVLEEIEELAEELLRLDPDMSIEAARSLVVEELPELYDEYSKAPPASPVRPVAKSVVEPTVRDEIYRVVRKRAGRMAWDNWPAKSLDDLEWEVWTSDEGKTLYELYRSPEGLLPLSVALNQVAASVHADAWGLLKTWRAG